MNIFVVRLNPDTRNNTPYSKYITRAEQDEICESAPMNGFYEAVNFLSENGAIRGYLPPKHLKEMRDGQAFILITITAKTATTGGDMIVGIQAGCKYEGENIPRKAEYNNQSLHLTWNYSCQESLSLLLTPSISGARDLVLGKNRAWIWGPTLKISKSIFQKIIKEAKECVSNSSDKNKISHIEKYYSDKIKKDRVGLDSESNFSSDVTKALDEDLTNIKGNEYPTQKEVRSFQYQRDPKVVAFALQKANGICDKCREKAPFISKNTGLPYLEVHHEVMLKDGGSDTPNNVVALCPNCHREKHCG